MRSKAGKVARELQFDLDYYSACYADFIPEGADAAKHYSTEGWKIGLNPNPFFSTKMYLAANRDVLKAGKNPFEHFLSSTEGTRPFVSPIFDPRFYLHTNSDVSPSDSPIAHYWGRGRSQGRSPSALFDIAYYRSQLGRGDGQIRDYLTHYLQTGWKNGLSPHPLFDPDYYRAQLDEQSKKIAPLAHYIEKGWRDCLSPHPLFDPQYYEENFGENIKEPHLLHYLNQNSWGSTPHYLFSDSYYANAVKKSRLNDTPKEYRSGPPLLHYCQIGAKEGVPTHPLFDVTYYKAEADRMMRDFADYRALAIELERDPLRHYCEIGVGLGLSPTPLFDPDFYRSQFAERISGDPLRHYLSTEGFAVASPHPGIDLDYYANRNSSFLPHELPLLLHFLMTPKEERLSTHPSLDPEFYLNRNPDIRDGGICPIQHFIEHGMREARQPNALFTYPYAHRLCKGDHPQFWNAVDGYFRERGNKRTRVLFLGHDASRSGAPLVMLGLVRHVSAIPDIECVTVLGSGGPLVDDFVHESLTYVVENNDRQFLEWNRHSPGFKKEMGAIADLLDENPPALVICNSLESRHLADFFVSRGYGPLVTLIHEVADPYDSAQLSRLIDASELCVYVSKYQIGRMQKKIALDSKKSAVVQFGALDRWFGSGDEGVAARKVQTELGLPPDARIVLGCGTMNFRKGIDIFADVACRILSQGGHENVHFVWVGGGETHYDSAFYWAQKFIRDRGFESNVHFVGEQSDTERYFLAADLFVLTSRADPYPCVVQEALACSLPIVAFEGTSGAAEAFGDSGLAVPFDAGAMASAVAGLLADDFQRRQRGRKAKEIVSSEKPFFGYANEVFRAMRDCVPSLSEEILSRAEPPPHADDKTTSVFITLESWDCSETSLFGEYVVKQLAKSGLDAELLFTRGPGTMKRQDVAVRLPDAPFSFLYPKSQSAEHVHEELVRYLDLTGGASVIVPFADTKVEQLLATLPPHVATMGLFHGGASELVEKAYEQSLFLDHIICTSNETRQGLLEANPRLRSKLSLIPPSVSVDKSRFELASGRRRKRGADDPIRIVCAGFGTGEVTAPVSCVRLAKLLREEQTPFHLSIFADAAESRAIRVLAPDLVRSDSFSIVEWPALEDIRSILETAELLIYASETGGSSLIVAEALAVGCVPIFQQLEQPLSSALEDGKNAHFIERGNLRKLVDVVSEYQRFPDRLQEMSQAAFRLARKSLSNEEAMTEHYVNACKKALVGRANRERERVPLRTRISSFLRTA